MATSKENLQIVIKAKGIADAKRQLKDLEKQNGASGTSFKAMALSIAGATAAMAGLAKAVQVGKDFEASMARVKAISNASTKEFKALSENAKALGASTAFTASEVSGLQTEFAKLGFTATEINKVTKGTLDLAGATGTDLATAASVAGSTLRGFGLDVSQTGRVTNLMAASFSQSALDMQKFTDSMTYVAPVAKMAGFSIEGTTAIMGQLANAGISGSMAGTALRRVFLELSNENSKLSKRLGGSVSSVDELIPALQKLNKEGVSTAEMKDLVGQRAISAFSILMDGADTLGEVTKNMTGTNEATRQYDIMMDTFQGSVDKMNSAFANLGITLFEISSGPLKAVVDGITKFASKLDAEQIKSYGLGLGIVAGAYGTYTASVRIATISTKAFRAALVSTGLGALAVGAGLLAGKLIEMTGVFGDAEEEAKDLADSIYKVRDANEALVLSLDFGAPSPLLPDADPVPGAPTTEQIGAKLSELDQFWIDQHKLGVDARLLEISTQEEHYLALAEAKQASEEEIAAIEAVFAEQRKQIKDKENESDIEDMKQAAQKTLGVANDIFGHMASIKQKDIDIEKKRLEEQGKSQEEIEKIQKKSTEDLKKLRYRQAQMAAFEAAINAYNSAVATPIVGSILGPIAGAAALGFGLKQAEQIKAAQYGMSEVVDKPTLILAGEGNKKESVNIVPLESPNINGPQQSSSVVVNVSGNLMSSEYVEGEEFSNAIRNAVRKGTDFGMG